MKAVVSINRHQRPDRPDYISIAAASGSGRVEITLDVEQFGLAITGRAEVPGELEIKPK